MINTIELENWKTHGSTKLQFSKGTNILIGQMGAGKSTIMDAISFALFGTFPSIKHRRVNVNEIIRNIPVQKDRASVKLNFTVGADTYTIERELSTGSGAKARIEKDGKYIQSQPQRVTEEVEKILKIDYDIFSKAIYSEQNRLDYFLELSASDRKKQIDALLGLDKFANAQENVGTLINRIKDLADENEKTAAGLDLAKLESQLDLLDKEKEKALKERELLEKELEKQNKEKTASDSELKSMKEAYNQKIKLEKEIAEHKSKLEMLDSEIKKIDAKKLGDLEEVEKKLEKTKSEQTKSKENARDTLQKERKMQEAAAKYVAELATLTKEKAEKEKLSAEYDKLKKSSIEKSIQDKNKIIDEQTKELAECNASIKENSKWIDELKKHVQKCPVCERELNESIVAKLLESKNKQVELLNSTIKMRNESLAKDKKELEKINLELNRANVIEQHLKSYSDVDVKIKDTDTKAKTAKAEAESAKKASDAANDLLMKLNDELNAITTSQELLKRKDGFVKDKETYSNSIEKKSKELGTINVDQKKLDELQKSFTELSSKISKSLSEIDANKRYQKDKETQISDKKSEISKIKTIYDDIKSKRKTADNLSKFRVSLQETQAALRTQLVDSINGIMHEVWPELYPYGDYLSVALEPTPDDYMLRVKLSSTKQWADVEAIASGGERSTACLAMRVAFALVLAPNLRWLILDEPTHNIDQQGLQKFVKMFGDGMPKIIDQIFIITHEETLKQAQNSRIYVFSRDKDANEVTKVTES